MSQIATAEEIIKFAEDNGIKIHPGQDPEKWEQLLIKKEGHCPCVPNRDHCPCEFVMGDIKELGRCRCGLFCNDAYIKEYNRLSISRRNRSTRRPRRSLPSAP